jgi:hypothetical protein
MTILSTWELQHLWEKHWFLSFEYRLLFLFTRESFVYYFKVQYSYFKRFVPNQCLGWMFYFYSKINLTLISFLLNFFNSNFALRCLPKFDLLNRYFWIPILIPSYFQFILIFWQQNLGRIAYCQSLLAYSWNTLQDCLHYLKP